MAHGAQLSRGPGARISAIHAGCFGRAWPLLLALALAFGSGACFLGYNSAWGQSKAAQKHLAADVTPGPIVAARGDGTATARHTYRVRFRPDGHYLAETVNPEQQIEQLVADANEVLRPAIGLELEVDALKPWGFDDDAKLEPALSALRTDDPGTDVDVVVGLVGALPGPTDSLHQVGYADVLGKHLVLRAAGRLGERDDIDRAFYELSDEEKARVALARRRHRAEAVFLHEIGHVLGALHEVERDSLMRPAYDEKMSRFGDDAVLLMGMALSEPDRDAVVKAQLAYVRSAKAAPWPTDERDQAVRVLEAMAAAHPAPGAFPSANVPPGAPASSPDLRAEDGPIFAKASQRFAAGSIADAYALARPLFDRYPRSIAVQDLRCQLATLRYLAKDALARECAPYTQLIDGGAPAGR
jgi:hypothetical protein